MHLRDFPVDGQENLGYQPTVGANTNSWYPVREESFVLSSINKIIYKKQRSSLKDVGLSFVCFVLTFVWSPSVDAKEVFEKEQIVVALGDSITAGTPGYRSPMEAPPRGLGNPKSQYAYWVHQRFRNWKIYNQGIAGQTSRQIFQRLDAIIQNLKPNILIVMAGVNDIYGGLPTKNVKIHLGKIYETAITNNIQVMALTILPYDTAGTIQITKIKEMNAWIKAYATEKGLGFCDTYAVMSDPANEGKLIRSADGLHPDVEGYRMMGEAIIQCAEDWLE